MTKEEVNDFIIQNPSVKLITDKLHKKFSEAKTGENHPSYGKHRTEETKAKMREAKIGKTYEEIMGVEKVKERKEKISKSMTGDKNPMKRPDVIEKNRKSGLKWIAEHKELAHETAVNGGKASCKAQNKAPNNPESYLLGYIQLWNMPYQFTGSGGFWIGDKNPDFTSTNGKKVVIEHLGSYWHGEEIQHQLKEYEEQEYITHYAQYGYTCKIIWENELYSMSEDELYEWLKNTMRRS